MPENAQLINQDIIRKSGLTPNRDDDFRYGTKVLVVDNDNFVCELIGKVLKINLGVDVVTAHSGRRAIAEALTGNYHAAIIDLILPHTSGMEAIKVIKEMMPDLPIVAITSDLTPARAEFVESCGVNTLFSKPVRIAALLEEIRMILDTGRDLPVTA